MHVLYLLHFPKKVSGAQHYCGITTLDGLRRRLRSHLGGWGAGLTARAAIECDHFRLTALWPHASPALERIIKDRGHLKNYCQICSGSLRGRQKRVHHVDIRISVDRFVASQIGPKPIDFP